MSSETTDITTIISERIAGRKTRLVVEDPSNMDELRAVVQRKAEQLCSDDWWSTAQWSGRWRDFGWSDDDKPTREMLAVSIAAEEVAKSEYAKGNKGAATWLAAALT